VGAGEGEGEGAGAGGGGGREQTQQLREKGDFRSSRASDGT
jgi:hypothetical protein